MKKAAALLVLGMLAACGTSESDPDGVVGVDVQYDGQNVADTLTPDIGLDVPVQPDTGECEITTNIRGFMDLCDGTVKDTNTGLIWEKGYAEPTGYEPNDIKRYCNGLKLGYNGGSLFEDWRAPTVDEVRTLIVGCGKTSLDGVCTIKHDCCRESCLGVDPSQVADCKCGQNGGPVEFPDDDPNDDFETWCYLDDTFEPWCNLYYSLTYVPKGAASYDRLIYVAFFNGKVGTVDPISPNGQGYVKCVRGQSEPQIPCVTTTTDNTPGCTLE